VLYNIQQTKQQWHEVQYKIEVTEFPANSVYRKGPQGYSQSLGMAFCTAVCEKYTILNGKPPLLFTQQFVLWATQLTNMKTLHIK